MDKLKGIINNYSRWRDLSSHLTRIEYQIGNDIPAAIGSTKSLLEAICKTILDYEKIAYQEKDKINTVVTKTIKSLKIENANPIDSLANHLINSINALGILRNKIDESSHGKSLLANKPQIDSITATFLMNSAETIACFLIEFYEIEHPRKKGEDEFDFQKMQEFNDYLDDQHGSVEIANIPYATSEALFAVDITAYKDEYRKYREVVNEQAN